MLGSVRVYLCRVCWGLGFSTQQFTGREGGAGHTLLPPYTICPHLPLTQCVPRPTPHPALPTSVCVGVCRAACTHTHPGVHLPPALYNNMHIRLDPMPVCAPLCAELCVYDCVCVCRCVVVTSQGRVCVCRCAVVTAQGRVCVCRCVVVTPQGRVCASYSAYEHSLGIKSTAWSPSGDLLALGSYDQVGGGGQRLGAAVAVWCERGQP